MLLSSGYVVCVAALITRAFLAASNCMWLQTFQTLLWGICLVIGCKFFIHLGSLGLAIAYVVSYLILTVLQLSTQFLVMGRLQRASK